MLIYINTPIIHGNMAFIFNPNMIDGMTLEEIKRVMSSGMFISASNKKKIAVRKEYLEKKQFNDGVSSFGPIRGSTDGTCKTSGTNSRGNISISSKKESVKKSTRILASDFESTVFDSDSELNSSISLKNSSNNSLKNSSNNSLNNSNYSLKNSNDSDELPNKKILSYNKIIGKEAGEADTGSEELFVDNDLVIDYNEIEKMYNAFAIDRMHIDYLNFCRKIDILNHVSFDIQTKYDYIKLCERKEIIKYCVQVYMDIKKTISLSVSYINTLINSDLNQWGVKDRLKELDDVFTNINNSEIHVFEEFSLKLRSVKKLFRESMINTIDNKIDQLQNIVEKLSTLLIYLVDKFDNTLSTNYEYYFEFKRQCGGNIIPKGISCYGYHSFENINMKLYDQEESYKNLSELVINKLFSQRYKTSKNGIIYVYPSPDSSFLSSNKQTKMKQIHINFTIADDIPFANGGVCIRNTPDNIKTVTSLIVNHKMSSSRETKTPLISDHIDKWYRNNKLSNSVSMADEYDNNNENEESSEEEIINQLLQQTIPVAKTVPVIKSNPWNSRNNAVNVLFKVENQC